MPDVSRDSEELRVSVRYRSWLFEAFEERGVDPEALLVDVPYSREWMCDPHRTIDWDSYCQYNRNIENNFSDEEIIEMARTALRQAF